VTTDAAAAAARPRPQQVRRRGCCQPRVMRCHSGCLAVFPAWASVSVLTSRAAEFHAQFVQVLGSASGAYASAEAANVSPLQIVEQDMLGVSNAPVGALTGGQYILIGKGADGVAGGNYSNGRGTATGGNGGIGG
jgi:PE family